MYSSISAAASSTRSPCPGRMVSGCSARTRRSDCHVVGHVALARMDDGGRAVEDVIAGVEGARRSRRRSTGGRECVRGVHGDQLDVAAAEDVAVGERAARARLPPRGRSSARVAPVAAASRNASGRWSGCECVSGSRRCAPPRGTGCGEDRCEMVVVVGPGSMQTTWAATDQVGVGAPSGEHRRVGREHAGCGLGHDALPLLVLERHPCGDDLGGDLGHLDGVRSQRFQDRFDGSEPGELVAHHTCGRHDRRKLEAAASTSGRCHPPSTASAACTRTSLVARTPRTRRSECRSGGPRGVA